VQGATRIALESRRWLRLLNIALDVGEHRATHCPGGGTVSDDCARDGPGSVRTTTYNACVVPADDSRRLIRDGTVSTRVDNPTFCENEVVTETDTVTLSLDGFRLRELDGSTPRAEIEATLTAARTRVRSSCAGEDETAQLDGALAIRCQTGATTLPCSNGPLDLTLSPQALRRDRQSGGFPCNTLTRLDGQLGVENGLSGETLTIAFANLAVSETEEAAGTRAAIDGQVAVDCLGVVEVRTDATNELRFAADASCPSGGVLTVSNPGVGVDLSGVSAEPAAPPPGARGVTPPEGELRQRLFRAAAGTLYQIVQNTGAGGGLGADAVLITTVVGSTASVAECANAADAISNPQAVVAASPGQAIALDAVVKSPRFADAGEPCFNRNAERGAGRVCLGPACTADCTCPAGAACSSFTKSAGIAIGATSTDVRAAVLVPSLAELDQPCSGFAGRSTYAFGGGTPTTEVTQCAARPSDGFELPTGASIVFVYDAPPLALTTAGAGGLLFDTDGVNQIGCAGTGRILNAGEVEKQSIAAPRVEFRSNSVRFDYDPDPVNASNPPDKSFPGCGLERLICGVTPAPEPDPERPCEAVQLGNEPNVSAPASTAAQPDHAGEASCGWSGGGSGRSDKVFEYVAREPGIYDITVDAENGFDPYLYVRDGDCLPSAKEISCAEGLDPGSASTPVTLAAGQRIAVIVDGERDEAGPFTLTIQQRRPDLVVESIDAPSGAPAGESISVAAEISNVGSGDAGPFTVEFFYSYDAAGRRPLNLAPLICEIPRLAAGARQPCVPRNSLSVPLVAGASYSLVARADGAGEVEESDETNNTLAEAGAIEAAPGAVLDQQVFRANDGTVYQLVEAVPVLSQSASGGFRFTSLAASLADPGSELTGDCDGNGNVTVNELITSVGIALERKTIDECPAADRDRNLRVGVNELIQGVNAALGLSGAPSGGVQICMMSGSGAGAPIQAAAAADELVPFAAIKRSAILRLNNFSTPEFEPAGSGRLIVGAGGATIEICADERCSGEPLVSLTDDTGGVDAACLATHPERFCPSVSATQTIAFGLSAADGVCDAASHVSTETEICNPAPPDGLGILPGEGIVFVYSAGREPFQLGLAGYEVAGGTNSVGCGPAQIIAPVVEQDHQSRAPLLRFVDAQRSAFLSAIAQSPDQRHLYAVTDGAVTILARSADSGTLTVIGEQRDGVGGVRGLRNAGSVTVSDDGQHVYVASRDLTVVVFARDEDSGALSFVEATRQIQGPHLDIFETSIAVTADGRHAYFLFGPGFASYSRDAQSGSLRIIELSGPGGRSIIASADGRHLYLARPGSVAVFARDAQNGALEFVEEEREGIGGADGLLSGAVRLTADERHVYVAGDAGVAAFARDAQTGALRFVDALRYAPDGGAFYSVGRASLVVSRDGRHVYATKGLSPDPVGEVVIFARDAESGRLRIVQTLKQGAGEVDGLDGAHSLLLGADGRYLYVASSTDSKNAIAAFARDASSGQLSFVDVLRRGIVGVDELSGAGSVTVSPDGNHVYVASQQFGGAVAVFKRDAQSGLLRFVEGQSGFAAEGASTVAVTSDGRHVYIGSLYEGMAVFARDAESGSLAFVVEVTEGIAGVEGLSVSADGRHVYVVGFSGMTVFSRDVQSGVLHFVEEVVQGLGDSDSALFLTSIAGSPDGRHVYVTGFRDFDSGTVVVFARDVKSGGLRFVDALHQGVAGVDGLAAAQSAAVSPDGGNLYVASFNTMAVFARAAQGGTLRLLQVVRQGTDGVDGLAAAGSVTVSPDGRRLFVASQNDDAVGVFERDTESGTLRFVEKQREGVDGVHGITYPASLAVSPDGRHVYVTSFEDDTVVLFAVTE
jgi:6-phosphogluconolactonase (cycloisomerase 2 family)